MGRIQKGYIYEASGAFFVRYYDSESIDKQIRRVQRSERLCSKDTGKHYAVNAKAVKLLRDRFMLTINERDPGSSPKDFTVVDFWEQKYLPFIEQNLKPSTVWGYKQIWAQHLKAHFGSMTLSNIERTMAVFLTGLAKTLGRHTLQHIRSLGSGVFSYAINESGLIESNPWHDVKILGKTKVSSETKHYTLLEAESVISALADHVDCQLIVALSFFLGLRSGEIQALRWEDFTNQSSDKCGICIKNGWRMPEPHVHVLRAIGRGIVGDTKTGIAAPLPLIEPVLVCSCGMTNQTIPLKDGCSPTVPESRLI
jgi:integrase